MKRFAITVCLLFLTAPALPETVVIGAPASQNIEVTVTRKGRPVEGVSVTFNVNNQEEPYWTGSTDANGKLFPPKLSPGSYRIIAKAGAREGELDLEVKEYSDHPKPREKFELVLILPQVGKAETAPVTEWVRDFRGVVVDPVDAVIPSAEVEVFLQKDVESGPVIKLQTDEKGRFSAHLDKGLYVGIFWAQGFAGYRLVFEVNDKGAPALRIPLKVGSAA